MRPEPTSIEIDGSVGGGQVLRTSLALSMATGQACTLQAIRGARPKPGLRAQHLACVRAAAEVCGAEVEGDELHSQRLRFAPGPVRAGRYRFEVGTAGSAMLVLHTVLPALMRPGLDPSQVEVTGGTHNPLAPPFEHTAWAWAGLVQALGARVDLDLPAIGFAPAGGGVVAAQVEPAPLGPVRLLARTGKRRLRARAHVANLPDHIGERELAALEKALGVRLQPGEVQAWDVGGGPDGEHPATSTGNALVVAIDGPVPAVLSELGEVRRRAEEVATRLARQVQRHLDHGGPVDEHLADQALLLLALGAGGSFRTGKPTEHLRTHAALIPRFLPECRIEVHPVDKRCWQVDVVGRGPYAEASAG